MPQSIRAVVVDPSSDARLILRDVELPPVARNDVTVRVTAISLNRGEVNRALSGIEAGRAPAGTSPAWSSSPPQTAAAHPWACV
jgi:NADPH:quinone reductase